MFNGRGSGQRLGGGQSLGKGGRGRQSGGFGLGPSGECICPKCENKVPHQQGVPCYEQHCPKCGTSMTRNR